MRFKRLSAREEIVQQLAADYTRQELANQIRELIREHQACIDEEEANNKGIGIAIDNRWSAMAQREINDRRSGKGDG